MRHLAQGFTRLLPSQCLVCHRWPGDVLCVHCVQVFAQPVARCKTCAVPMVSGAPQCGQCMVVGPPVDRCVAAVDYAYPWDQVLVDFKFHAHVGLARAMARLMRAAPWIEAELEAADMLVPMPLSTQRLSERGFNQSLVLARALEHAHIASDVLVRVRDTPPQSSLSRTERTSNVQGAYLPNPAKAQSIRDQRIVILDDVMTTGASMRAAAQALRQAGARSVSGLIFARTA